MPISGHADPGSYASADPSIRIDFSATQASLASYRLDATNGLFGRMNPWTHLSIDRQHRPGLPASIDLLAWDEKRKGASMRHDKPSSPSPRPKDVASGNDQSENDREKSSSPDTLHTSPAPHDTDLVSRPRHAEGLDDASKEILFHAVTSWYHNWLARWASTASSNQDGENHQSTTGTTGSSGSQSQQQQQIKQKRKRQDRGRGLGKVDEDMGEGGDGGPDYPPLKKPRGPKLRLACPFFKRNALRYADHQYCLHHWPSTSRLK
jgi:hypothetical protein